MNPFLWPGPSFLAFQAILSAIAVLWLVHHRRHLAPSDGQRHRLRDPFTIARLRGGPVECLRVVALSLLDAGALECSGRVLTSTPGSPVPAHPLQAAMLGWCSGGAEAHGLVHRAAVRQALAEADQPLRQAGLLPSREAEARFHRHGMILAAVLAAVAAIKVAVALDHGHHRVVFLLMLAGLGVFTVLAVTWSGRDELVSGGGRQAIAYLQTMFSTFRDGRRAQTMNAEERLFTAAVFGVVALGGRERTLWAAFTPPPSESSSSASDTSTFNSDSSLSTSSGCGSSSSCGSSGCGGCGGGGGD